MCGRVRLSSDYSEIKIRLKFAPNSVAPNFEPDWNKPPTVFAQATILAFSHLRVVGHGNCVGLLELSFWIKLFPLVETVSDDEAIAGRTSMHPEMQVWS
jgi:hypothetical protein